MGSNDPARRKVVLVVEDEPLLLLLAVEVVEDAGFEAVAARDADQAFDILLRRTDIQVVFTDVDMPGSMDGLKLAAAVRHRWPPIEIIVTSGKMTPDRSKLPEGSRFFAKPYDVDQIAEALQRMAA